MRLRRVVGVAAVLLAAMQGMAQVNAPAANPAPGGGQGR